MGYKLQSVEHEGYVLVGILFGYILCIDIVPQLVLMNIKVFVCRKRKYFGIGYEKYLRIVFVMKG